MKEKLSARREEQQDAYVPKPLDLSEYKTRKLYIDSMLQDAGWTEGEDWINEYELPGMPNKSEVGYADYVLMGNDGRILAVIEAKRTCVDVSKGRQQAKLYADLIEEKQKRRPVVFLQMVSKQKLLITNIRNEKYQHFILNEISKSFLIFRQ